MNALNNEISTKNNMIYTSYNAEAQKDMKTIVYTYCLVFNFTYSYYFIKSN